MTIAELLNLIHSAIAAGTITEEDAVKVRDLNVSPEAMSAGSNGWTEPSNVLVIGSNDSGMDAGVYLELEEDY
ncbi:hypothetical protein SEA_FIREMAN_66 [Microbacterium phage Fireman]|uniref:Uncharacterized protein n=2 Tax=Metamorphoovirus TaxID=2733195 RepID=A0A481VWM8_9CAUD|nr:hypothetical protein HOT43_gp69 [Microbacterium phage RobsFeet]YP_009820302.1 hypothetical protein HOV22_gp67 [Microbacterium phage Fireman]AWY06073.1 hypothetical protein SEA_ROBSFEET_67 [Microbacterium phage RobsFeet]QBI98148.1 hypothetical protein SEA_FIREMAN_66 [Microbacterium phage Fireman]